MKLLFNTHSVVYEVMLVISENTFVSTIVTIVILQSELNEMKRECSSLKEKLKMQRETAASSLNKIQQENQEKSAQLRAKIQEMSEKINQVLLLL